MFDVIYDPDTNCINISVRGFWEPDDVLRLSKAVGSKVIEARSFRSDFNACVESLGFPVQAMDVAELLAQIMRDGMAMTSGRAAVVVGSLLNKAQAERTLIHPRVRVFIALGEARDWLGIR